MSDPYKILGLERGASEDQVKKAYRNLSRKYHPDANVNNPNKDQAEEKFKEIQQAYKQIMSGEANRTEGGYGQGQNGNYGSPFGAGSAGGQGDPGGFYGGFGPEFFGFGGYGSNHQEDYDPNDKNSRYFHAAKNYLKAGSYEEARNILNQIDDRNAKWHYYAGVCNAGLGNQIRALEMLSRAIQMEPGNNEYRQAYEAIKSGSNWYMDRGTSYGMDMSGNRSSACCNTLCTICCLMQCAGYSCCPYGGFGGYGR